MTIDHLAPVRTVTCRMRLRPGARTEAGPDGVTWLVGPRRGISLGRLDAGQQAVLAALQGDDGAAEEELPGIALAAGGIAELRTGQALVNLLQQGRWTSSSLRWDGEVLLTVDPGPVTSRVPAPWRWIGPVTLSRFALLRRDGAEFVLETATGAAVACTSSPALLALLTRLTTAAAEGGLGPDAADRLAEDLALPRPVLDRVMALLAANGFLAGPGAEDNRLEAAQWSPHELYFHARTRMGLHELPYGGTYWAADRFEPLPSRHPAFSGNPAVELYRPDLDALRADDLTLTQVLETRRSIRAQDQTRPLTARQLGEFLYRTARVRGVRMDGGQEILDRPYPAGGSLHELEFYPVLVGVDGIPDGMYHYDAHSHRLEQVPTSRGALRRLVDTSARLAQLEQPSQVTVVMAARFGRLMWKYQTMGYALVLKNVGVVYQTMYAVATAMGLAACALGGGDVEEFAVATGLDPLAESSVGEFVLGSAPAAEPDAAPSAALTAALAEVVTVGARTQLPVTTGDGAARAEAARG